MSIHLVGLSVICDCGVSMYYFIICFHAKIVYLIGPENK